MNYTKLFTIEWDDSYNDPDFAIPGTMNEWLNKRSKKDIKRLAEMLEFLAKQIIKREAPFKEFKRLTRFDLALQKQDKLCQKKII